MNRGEVYIIGAGCGSMELITLRGLERLRSCDAVVYDDLIDEALLDLVPEGSECIYMGKRSGKHSAAQEEISNTLVELALSGKRVARLKGGDPFVFGRGGEEVLALQKAGVAFEVIPGISSSIAIPALAGIPVTHRGLSRSFHVITAHCADGDALPEDLKHLAALHGTLVFLMGLGKLERLAEGLMAEGRPSGTPAAVISGGNSPNPAAVRGMLGDIAQLSRRAEIKPPAVIVVGPAAAMELNKGAVWRALEGIKVGITGTDSITSKLSTALRQEGARPVLVERSEVMELPIGYDIEKLCDGGCHWLVFTSANGVRIFLKQLREQRCDLRRLHKCKFAVIGRATGELLEEQGIFPELCPEEFTSEALAEALSKKVCADEDVILLRARNGAEILPRKLSEERIKLSDIALYDLSPDESITQHHRRRLENLNYLTFSSAEGVKLFMQQYGSIPDGVTCVCIGKVCAKALAEVCEKPFLTAESTDAEGIVRVIIRDRQS